MRALGPARVLAAALMIAALTGSPASLRPGIARAWQQGVAPWEVALTPADLPPGFVVVADATRSEAVLVAVADAAEGEPLEHEEHDVHVQHAGVRFTTELKREPGAEDPGSGPITVGQTITRIDALIVPADLLAQGRDRLIRDEGFALLPEPSNDPTTVQLVKNADGGVVYAVGVLKADTVIFTSVGGPRPGVDLDVALALAGRSAAKYDLLAAASSGEVSADSGIVGQVVIGPSCPGLEREGAECQDRPHEASVTILNDTGAIVTRVQTDADGRFRVSLDPGTYILRPEPSGPFSSADEQAVVVTRARFVHVRITYDRGV